MTLLLVLIWLCLIYYLSLQGFYLLFILLSAWQVRKHKGGVTYAEFRRIAHSPLTTPVSLIIPAHNEAAIIANTVRNALMENYPHYEVIVVNDGSTDNTLGELVDAFHLRRVERYDPVHIETRKIRGVYRSPDHPRLLVVDKENGRRADAINAAETYASHPLLCVIDADCILEADTLLRLVRPFLRDSHVAAVAGIVRPSNGLTLENGEILHRGLPRTLLGMNQEVEYDRSFQWARMGLCRLHSMLCISGALMMIKRSVFREVGGPSPEAITDDMEFTVRLNAHIYDRKRPVREKLVFLPDAVCYTEVPETFRMYVSQRNRWTRGTLQALCDNWHLLFNPRYGRTGLFGFPFFFLYESAAPLVEITALILMGIVLALGMVTGWEILVVLYFAYILNVFLTLTAILLTEASRTRANSWRDLWKILFSIFLDNFGFHQLRVVVWLVAGFQYHFLGRRDLGADMTRLAAQKHAP